MNKGEILIERLGEILPAVHPDDYFANRIKITEEMELHFKTRQKRKGEVVEKIPHPPLIVKIHETDITLGEDVTKSILPLLRKCYKKAAEHKLEQQESKLEEDMDWLIDQLNQWGG